MAKLDPANWKSAKDVYDERVTEAAKKRKREIGNTEDSEANLQDQPESSRPPTKKVKANTAEIKASLGKITERQDSEAIQNENFKKRAKKRANRLKKNEEMRQKKQEKKAQKVAATEQVPQSAEVPSKTKVQDEQSVESRAKKVKKDRSSSIDRRPLKDQDMMEVDDFSALAGVEESAALSSDDEAEEEEQSQAVGSEVEEDQDEDEDEEESGYSTTTTLSSQQQAEIFSPPQESAASSVSSLQAPTAKTEKPSKIAIPPVPNPTLVSDSKAGPTNGSVYDKQAARQRLQQALSGFRAQRKADDKAPRSRAELLAQRKRQEDERKAVKKEQKRQEKEEEARRQEEEMVRRFSPGGSGSLLGSPRSPMVEGGGNAFSFGRIAFEDGTHLNPSDLSLTTEKRRKGPQDVKTALQAVQAKNARIAGYDEDKRKVIENKEAWSSMNKRASGEKTKDNTSLLKKALKRQDKQKLKSSKEWNERKEGVQSSIDARQKKRTENIQARKDAKAAKKTGVKVKKRAGFEGSFRGRSGKTKNK